MQRRVYTNMYTLYADVQETYMYILTHESVCEATVRNNDRQAVSQYVKMLQNSKNGESSFTYADIM